MSTVYAQEVVDNDDKKAAKMQEKEAKKKEKEAKKAEKEKAKAEKKEAKKEKKDKKIAKLEAEYAEFIANYQPLEANTGYAEIDSFYTHTNELFETLVQVEQSIGYIEVKTHMEVDEATEEEIQVLDGIVNKNTGEEITKKDAWKAYGLASLQLTTAGLTAANLVLEGTSAIASSLTDPVALMTIGGKAKKVLKSIKMSGQMIPIIQRRIQENKDAINYKENN